MTYYYIAYNQPDYAGSVICYGSGPTPDCPASPVGSYQSFDDYDAFAARLAELGYTAAPEESYAIAS